MNESLENAAAEKKAWLQLVIAAALCFMVYKLLLAPLFYQLGEQARQQELLQRELCKYREFAAAHQDYEAFLRQRTERLEQLQRRLPVRVVFSEQLALWQRQAQSCGVTISDIKLLNETDNGDKKLKSQPVRITLAGNYYSVLKFVHELEKSENFVNINKVNITGDENKGDIKFTAVFNIYLYVTGE